jgi:hypothetical protein
VLRILLEHLARAGKRYLAAAAVKQPCANFFFKRADLRRDSGLRAKAPFRRAGKTGVARDLQKRFQLIKVHVISDSWLRTV